MWETSSRVIGQLGASFLFIIIFLAISVTLHESFHIIGANIVGCEARTVSAVLFRGATSVKCPLKWQHAFSATFSPMMMFIVGFWVWSIGKDLIWRLGSLIMWFYSTLPSLAFWIPSSDLGKAVASGMPLNFALFLFVVTASLIAFYIAREITERKWIF